MAKTSIAKQPWKSSEGKIVFEIPRGEEQKWSAKIQADGFDFSDGKIVWEIEGQEPVLLAGDKVFQFERPSRNDFRIEAEAQLPDGRRVFAVADGGEAATAKLTRR